MLLDSGTLSPLKPYTDFLLLCDETLGLTCLALARPRSSASYPNKAIGAARKELSKEAAVSKTLQGLCRTLQTQNADLSKHLELKLSKEQETSKQSENLQQAISDITTRRVFKLPSKQRRLGTSLPTRSSFWRSALLLTSLQNLNFLVCYCL